MNKLKKIIRTLNLTIIGILVKTQLVLADPSLEDLSSKVNSGTAKLKIIMLSIVPGIVILKCIYHGIIIVMNSDDEPVVTKNRNTIVRTVKWGIVIGLIAAIVTLLFDYFEIF